MVMIIFILNIVTVNAFLVAVEMLFEIKVCFNIKKNRYVETNHYCSWQRYGGIQVL